MKTKVKTVKQKVIIPASPEEVYEATLTQKNKANLREEKLRARLWSAANSGYGWYHFWEIPQARQWKTRGSRVEPRLSKRLDTFRG